MFVEIIHGKVGYRGNTALRFGRIGFVKRGLAAERNLVLMFTRHFQRKTHTGYTSADDEEIVLFGHMSSEYFSMLVSIGNSSP